MTFSDLYLTRTVKIEILPTDKLQQVNNFLVKGDRVVAVFRPVHSSEVVTVLNRFFLTELQSYKEQPNLSLSDALQTVIHTHNVSQLNFMGKPEVAPESGAMVLMVYIDPKNQCTLAQVGDVTLKQRQNGRFTTLTANHTFHNPIEVERLTTYLRQAGITQSPETVISSLAISEGFGEKVSSRFIGHPTWCSWGGEYGESFINTQPFITTFALG